MRKHRVVSGRRHPLVVGNLNNAFADFRNRCSSPGVGTNVGFLLSSSRKALRWRYSRNSHHGPGASDTQLEFLKAWCPRRWTKPNAMRIEVMRGHTKSLDANDKLIQTRSHERDTITSRKWQVVMRKVKSTIAVTKLFSKWRLPTSAICIS